jgi:hypothetical protein
VPLSVDSVSEVRPLLFDAECELLGPSAFGCVLASLPSLGPPLVLISSHGLTYAQGPIRQFDEIKVGNVAGHINGVITAMRGREGERERIGKA